MEKVTKGSVTYAIPNAWKQVIDASVAQYGSKVGKKEVLTQTAGALIRPYMESLNLRPKNERLLDPTKSKEDKAFVKKVVGLMLYVKDKHGENIDPKNEIVSNLKRMNETYEVRQDIGKDLDSEMEKLRHIMEKTKDSNVTPKQIEKMLYSDEKALRIGISPWGYYTSVLAKNKVILELKNVLHEKESTYKEEVNELQKGLTMLANKAKIRNVSATLGKDPAHMESRYRLGAVSIIVRGKYATKIHHNNALSDEEIQAVYRDIHNNSVLMAFYGSDGAKKEAEMKVHSKLTNVKDMFEEHHIRESKIMAKKLESSGRSIADAYKAVFGHAREHKKISEGV